MLHSPRILRLITAAQVLVFAAATWWAGGLRGDGLALELVLMAVNTVPLLLLTWNPLVVVFIFAAAYPTFLVAGYEGHILQSLPSLTAMYATGAWSRPLPVRSAALLSPAFMMTAALTGWWGVTDPLEIGYVAVVFAIVWILGVLIARLEHAEGELAERAVAEEQARIARELHDVVAHAMSVITVQAGVGAHLIESNPAQAAASLRTIEGTGREAMEEMRRMLAMLKGSDWDGEVSEPQPRLSDVHRLVAQMERVGIEVELREEGEEVGLSPGLDLAGYRVVQEALTNAAKHAPGSAVEVAIRRTSGELEVEVLTRGRVSDRFHPGQGLRGMAERVTLYDGDLEAGPDAEGFRVRAVFPAGDRE